MVTRRIFRILILLTVALSGACHDISCMKHTHCDDTILERVKSPDGKFVAVLYERACANRTGLSTCVKIEDVAEPDGEPGHVLIVVGLHKISAKWKDAANLQVECAGLPDSIIATQKHEWKQLKIFYNE